MIKKIRSLISWRLWFIGKIFLVTIVPAIVLGVLVGQSLTPDPTLASWTAILVWATFLLAFVAGAPEIVKDLFDLKPELTLSLFTYLHSGGEYTGGRALVNNEYRRYYHLHVINRRKNFPARYVRVVITKIWKGRKGSDLTAQPMAQRLHLKWQPPEDRTMPDIGGDEVCNLGFLSKSTGFQFDAYFEISPISRVKKDEEMRVLVQAVADNCKSNSLYLRIKWDGIWLDDEEGKDIEMSHHLMIDSHKDSETVR